MKDAFGGTALFMIVIFFVVLFTGYLCMSINQSKAFAVKNSLIRILERHGVGKYTAESVVTASKDEIIAELKDVGYRTKGKCEGSEVGFNSQGNTTTNNPVFCVEYIGPVPTGGASQNPNDKLHYFKVRTFYHFDIPGLINLFRWTIEGTTKSMM